LSQNEKATAFRVSACHPTWPRDDQRGSAIPRSVQYSRSVGIATPSVTGTAARVTSNRLATLMSATLLRLEEGQWSSTWAQFLQRPDTLRRVNLKRRVPFLRSSAWRLAIGVRNITSTGQIGDGREAAAVDYVLQKAKAGDVDDVLATLDRFAYEKSMLINVGDEKGALLDVAVRRANPKLALELGTYCGYGALRIVRAAPAAKVYSVELAEANAVNARQIWAHAGVADRVTCVVGIIGDGGRTLDALAAEHGFAAAKLDFLFLDHDQDAYLTDLPGAPKYREYMRRQQGTLWNTIEHKTHLEYQRLVTDLVLESEYLGSKSSC
jgi:catechol O-methyltransferase